jgi:hypothetical protein
VNHGHEEQIRANLGHEERARTKTRREEHDRASWHGTHHDVYYGNLASLPLLLIQSRYVNWPN